MILKTISMKYTESEIMLIETRTFGHETHTCFMHAKSPMLLNTCLRRKKNLHRGYFPDHNTTVPYLSISIGIDDVLFEFPQWLVVLMFI